MKVAVVTSTSPNRKDIFDVSYPNMKEYCNKHGYIPIVIHLEDGGWHYKKHETFNDLFHKGYDLIWYRDDDSVITNMTIPIESFIDDQHELFICEDDIMGINGGSLIIKNNNGGKWVNDFILSHKKDFNNEQEVMEYYKDELFLLGYMKILPHPSINSYPYEMYPELDQATPHEKGNWREGDFLLHCPALPYEKRAEILRKAKIIK